MVDLALGAVAGFVLGTVHMWMLWRASMRLRVETGASALLGGAFLRLAVVLAGFAAAAGLAAQPGLALAVALCGFAVIRAIALRRVWGGPHGDQP